MEKKTTNPSEPENDPDAADPQRHNHAPSAAADYDAELRNWCFHGDAQFTTAFGRVFSDRKGRWPDGYAIATSPVVEGARKEGAVITTLNTRYLLSGPAGDEKAMLRLARQHAANGKRRMSVADDEWLFDLLPAAWGMDDATFEQLAGLPARWLWQWRNHYRAPSDEELARLRRLARFHNAIQLVTYCEPNYAAWWRRCWSENSLIGKRSPLDAVLNDPALLDTLERYFWAQM